MILERDIHYGMYHNNKWLGLVGVTDPLFIRWCEVIKPLLLDYELWIYGGILEGWETFDIDGSIIGPHNPKVINQILQNVIEASYELQIFPDIKYAFDNKLFNWSDYMATGKRVTIKYAHYQPEITVNGKVFKYGTLENELWVAERTWPLTKTINKNHNFSDSLKLF